MSNREYLSCDEEDYKQRARLRLRLRGAGIRFNVPRVAPPTDYDEAIAFAKLLHRHSDGYIAFAVRSDESFVPLLAMRADDLEAEFSKMWSRLRRDSYVSLNSSYCHSRNKRVKAALPEHSTRTLRHLCACYCDIDCYKQGLTPSRALNKVLLLCRDGQLPPVSISVDTGRGLWMLWLLRDRDDADKAHFGGWQDNRFNHVQLFSRVNAEIATCLYQFGADPSAIDGARYVRLPGSWRNDEENTVHYRVHLIAGSIPIYELQELAAFFKIERRPRTVRNAPQKADTHQFPARRKGLVAARRNCLKAFRTLQGLRDGFQSGQRNNAALIYAVLLKVNGFSRKEVEARIDHLGASCIPQLTRWQRKGAVKSAFKPKMQRFSYQRIADALDVTPDEAATISAQIGKKFPAAAHFPSTQLSDPADVTNSRTQQRTERQNLIKAILKETSHKQPSLRKLQEMLRENGIRVSHVTIRNDLRLLRRTESTGIGGEK